MVAASLLISSSMNFCPKIKHAATHFVLTLHFFSFFSIFFHHFLNGSNISFFICFGVNPGAEFARNSG